MEACEFWWVLLENIEGCNYLVRQHATNEGHGTFLSGLVQHLLARLPLTETQVTPLSCLLLTLSPSLSKD
jgi:hypothetical protein